MARGRPLRAELSPGTTQLGIGSEARQLGRAGDAGARVERQARGGGLRDLGRQRLAAKLGDAMQHQAKMRT